MKLNGQPKWNLFIAKSAAQATEEETDDPTDPTKEPPKKVRRGFRGKKWEEERVKREGAAVKMTVRFENILYKKEEAYVKCCYLLSTALVFPEEEGMMQQSSVSISLSF